jgi:hypothetical protein
MEGVGRPSLWLHTESIVGVVDHPVGHGWSGGECQGKCVTPSDLRRRGDAHERIVPSCARSWRGNAAIDGRMHLIDEM